MSYYPKGATMVNPAIEDVQLFLITKEMKPGAARRLRRCNPRRARGDRFHHDSRNSSGRIVAFARATISDIEEADAFDEDDAIGESPLVVGYSSCAAKHVQARAKEELREQTRELCERDARMRSIFARAAHEIDRLREELKKLLEFLVSSGGRSEAIVAAVLRLFELDIAAQYAAA